MHEDLEPKRPSADFDEVPRAPKHNLAVAHCDTSCNSTDQLRGLGPKSDYDKDQKTEVAMFSFFYVDS